MWIMCTLFYHNTDSFFEEKAALFGLTQFIKGVRNIPDKRRGNPSAMLAGTWQVYLSEGGSYGIISIGLS